MVSQERLNEINNKLTAGTYSTWQECYADYLYIRKQKVGTVDTKILIELSNLTIKKGLQFTVDQEAYLSVIKFLAALYIQTGDYDRAINELNLVVQLQEEVPCWVYHNYIDAEIHIEKKLDRILRKPKNFLSDLSRDNGEGDNEFVFNRQQNILKEFFRQGTKYIYKTKNVDIERKEFEAAAEKYRVNKTLEFEIFEKTLSGANPDELYKAQENDKYKKLFDEVSDQNKKLTDSNKNLKQANNDLSSINSDLVVQNQDLSNKNESLESTNQSLTNQNKELGDKNTELSSKNAILNKEIEKAQKELEATKAEIEELKQGIQEKKDELDILLKTQSDSFDKEKSDLLTKIAEAQDKLITKDKFIESRNEIIKKLRNDIEILKNEKEKAAILPPNLMVAKCLRPVTDSVYLWAKKRFPDLDIQENWNNFVLTVFQYDDLQNDNVHHLEDFDLQRLIKLIRDYNNFGYLLRNGKVDTEDKSYFTDLKYVRNHFAHFPISDNPEDEEYILDLKNIKRVLENIGAAGSFRTEIREYLESRGE